MVAETEAETFSPYLSDLSAFDLVEHLMNRLTYSGENEISFKRSTSHDLVEVLHVAFSLSFCRCVVQDQTSFYLVLLLPFTQIQSFSFRFRVLYPSAPFEIEYYENLGMYNGMKNYRNLFSSAEFCCPTV